MSRLIGVDVGFTALGVVIVDGDRVLFADTCRTEKTARRRGLRVADDDAERAQQLARFLWGVIQEWRPAGAVVELPTGGSQGARSARAMGMASGVVAAVLEMTALPSEWVTPQEVKRAAAGRKDASKAEVEAAVRERFAWPEGFWRRPTVVREHVCDAAGAIMAAQNGLLVRALLGGQQQLAGVGGG